MLVTSCSVLFRQREFDEVVIWRKKKCCELLLVFIRVDTSPKSYFHDFIFSTGEIRDTRESRRESNPQTLRQQSNALSTFPCTVALTFTILWQARRFFLSFKVKTSTKKKVGGAKTINFGNKNRVRHFKTIRRSRWRMWVDCRVFGKLRLLGARLRHYRNTNYRN